MFTLLDHSPQPVKRRRLTLEIRSHDLIGDSFTIVILSAV
jgi:hypothetical protein